MCDVRSCEWERFNLLVEIQPIEEPFGVDFLVSAYRKTDGQPLTVTAITGPETKAHQEILVIPVGSGIDS